MTHSVKIQIWALLMAGMAFGQCANDHPEKCGNSSTQTCAAVGTCFEVSPSPGPTFTFVLPPDDAGKITTKSFLAISDIDSMESICVIEGTMEHPERIDYAPGKTAEDCIRSMTKVIGENNKLAERQREEYRKSLEDLKREVKKIQDDADKFRERILKLLGGADKV